MWPAFCPLQPLQGVFAGVTGATGLRGYAGLTGASGFTGLPLCLYMQSQCAPLGLQHLLQNLAMRCLVCGGIVNEKCVKASFYCRFDRKHRFDRRHRFDRKHRLHWFHWLLRHASSLSQVVLIGIKPRSTSKSALDAKAVRVQSGAKCAISA